MAQLQKYIISNGNFIGRKVKYVLRKKKLLKKIEIFRFCHIRIIELDPENRRISFSTPAPFREQMTVDNQNFFSDKILEIFETAAAIQFRSEKYVNPEYLVVHLRRQITEFCV